MQLLVLQRKKAQTASLTGSAVVGAAGSMQRSDAAHCPTWGTASAQCCPSSPKHPSPANRTAAEA